MKLHSSKLKVAVACAAAIVITVAVPISAAGDDWIRLETASFTLISNADEDLVRKVGVDLERLRHVIGQLTSARLGAPVPTHLYVFRNHETMAPYQLRHESPGYLVPHEHAVYAALNVEAGHHPASIVRRQYILHLFHASRSKLPLWFRYGVAELFSSFEADDQEVRIGLPVSDRLLSVKVAGPTTTLAKLLTAETLPRQDTLQFYRMSWAVVHYLLIGDDELRERVPAYMRAIARGTPSLTAWRQVFEVEPAALEAKLQEYLRQDSIRYIKMPVAGMADLSAEAVPLAEHEAFFHLGDLLVHTAPERHDEATAYFRRALELAPEHSPSWGGLGYAAELAGRHDEARDHYQKAAAQAPDDALIQYLHGESLLRAIGGRRPSNEEELALLRRAREALESATRTRPAFAQAWVRLGYAHSLEPRPSAAEVEALSTAAGLLPGRTDVHFNLLLAHARAGNRELAEETRRNLELLGADDATLGRAREVLLQLDFRDATAMLRQSRMDDAVAVFARIQATTRDPSLAERAAEYLETASSAARHNHFVEPYNRAVRLLGARDLETAAAVIEELAADARPGRQAEAVARLREQLAQLRGGSGG